MIGRAFLVVALLFAAASCDDDGQYRPEKYGGDDGKYHPDDSGRYIHQEDGGAGDYNARFAQNKRFSTIPVTRNLIAPTFEDSNQRFINRFQVDEAAASNISPFSRKPIGVIGSGRSTVATSQLSSASSRSQQSPDGRSQILRQDVEVGPEGYHFSYETDNSIKVEEDGRLVNPGTKSATIAATGFYEYVGPDGVKYRVDYIADENGFQPLGEHLPTPPPIPDAIRNILVERN